MPAAQAYLKNLLMSLALGSLKIFSLPVTQSTLITIVKKKITFARLEQNPVLGCFRL